MNELQQTIDTVLAKLRTMTISNDNEMVVAAEWLKECKIVMRAVEAEHAPSIEAANAAHKAAVAAKKATLVPLEKAEAAVKLMLSSYESKRRQEREAERRRLEAEARAKEEERRLAEAVSTGDEKLLDEPIETPAVVQEKPVRVEGVSYVDKWDWSIVQADAIPREYLMVDEKKVNGVVRSMKGETRIPGIAVTCSKVVRAG